MLPSADYTAYCVASDVPEAKASAVAPSTVMIPQSPWFDVSCCFSSSEDGSVIQAPPPLIGLAHMRWRWKSR